MTVAPDAVIDLLDRTPRVLRAMLEGLGEDALHATYGPDTFSPFDALAHLVESERSDWMPRVRHLLKHGVEAPFQPFDRYAHFEAHAHASVDELLDAFAAARRASLEDLRSLAPTPDDLRRLGLHPRLGEVTLAQLLATWAVHDLNHTAQIARGLAASHADAVGPWRSYLGILNAPTTPMDAEGVSRKQAAMRDRARSSG